MRCQEVKELLVAYLDNEVTPSEQTLIRAHLAGCDACQQKLAALSALQSHVSQSLKVRAAQVAPSPQAWSRLQARLAREAHPSWFQRPAMAVRRARQVFQPGERMTLKQGFLWALVAVLVITAGTMAFVPSVRAQVGEAIAQWFRSEVRSGRLEIRRMPSPGVDFTPLHPTYLPGSPMCTMEDDGKGKAGAFRQAYAGKDWFVDIIQTKSPADRSLPTGWGVSVNGQPGVLNTGLQGKFEFTPRFEVQGDLCSSVYIYTNGKQLTWYVSDIKVVMLSNLADEEMLKIAQSMMPLERDMQ